MSRRWSHKPRPPHYLHLVHPIHDVEHLLEDSLQAEVHLQPEPPLLQQLQQVLPQPDHVVLPRRDAFDVMVTLRLQLLGHGNHRLQQQREKRRMREMFKCVS